MRSKFQCILSDVQRMKSSGTGDLGILLSCYFAWCKDDVLPAPRVTAPVFGKPVVLQAFPGEELAPSTWQSCVYPSFPNTCHFTSKADSLHARTPRRKTYAKHMILIICIPNYLDSMLCFPFYLFICCHCNLQQSSVTGLELKLLCQGITLERIPLFTRVLPPNYSRL